MTIKITLLLRNTDASVSGIISCGLIPHALPPHIARPKLSSYIIHVFPRLSKSIRPVRAGIISLRFPGDASFFPVLRTPPALPNNHIL